VAPATEYEPSAPGPAYAAGPGQLAEPAYAAGPGQLAEPAYAAGPGQPAETSYQGGSVGPDANVYSDGDALDSYGAPLGMFIDHYLCLNNSFEWDLGVTTPPSVYKDDLLPVLPPKSSEIIFS
jgi:hypothetical protein